MTRMQLGRWQNYVQWSVALMAGGILTACCPSPPKPPEPVAACPRGRAPTSATELKACLQGQKFDSAPEAGDEQPLLVIGKGPGAPCPGDSTRTCRYGPQAKIEPLIGADQYSESDLRQGRIIARLSLLEGETESYPKFGLTAGQVTYWWVRTDSTGTGGESVFVTTSGDERLVPVSRPLVRELYRKGTKLTGATARWIWTLEDETTQGHCGTATCK